MRQVTSGVCETLALPCEGEDGWGALRGRYTLAWQGLTVPVLEELSWLLICEQPCALADGFPASLRLPAAPRGRPWGRGFATLVGRRKLCSHWQVYVVYGS